jgi:hypothetical protein
MNNPNPEKAEKLEMIIEQTEDEESKNQNQNNKIYINPLFMAK